MKVCRSVQTWITFWLPFLVWLQVAWIKSDSKAILAIHTHMVSQNPRLNVTHNGHNTWKLNVHNVLKSDAGTYMCQINTDPMKSQVSFFSFGFKTHINVETLSKANQRNIWISSTCGPKFNYEFWYVMKLAPYSFIHISLLQILQIFLLWFGKSLIFAVAYFTKPQI